MVKIALVIPKMANGERGGAENLFEGLLNALKKAGHEASLIEVLVDESSFEGILKAYCTCYYMDLDDYDMVISTKAPTYMVRHRNHVSYLLHTVRVFYDMFESQPRDEADLERRRLIHSFDKHGLSKERIARYCVIGRTVVDRFLDADPFWKGIDFHIVYPATRLSAFKEPVAGEFIFLPGRLHRWKRADLVIEAMTHIPPPTKLLIAGDGEERTALQALASKLGLGDRVVFLGRVSDDELLDLYSRSIAVPFTPMSEDFGYVTIEAFKSKKPVICCRDSGEPSLIVKDGESGFIVDPEPVKVAEKLVYLIEHPDKAKEMGENGFRSVSNITWENVVRELLMGPELRPRAEDDTVRVLIADMQPIEPAVGGGRLRLKGLYSNMGPGVEPLYIGSYDWEGQEKRRIQVSESLTEQDIPLSRDHFKLVKSLSKFSPGKTLIDVTFPLLAESSPEYVDALVDASDKADVIIFSHPWAYATLKTRSRLIGKLLVYDSQNCEGLLREDLLGDMPFSRCVSNMVKFVEGTLCEDCDLILACSEDDKAKFELIYGVPGTKIDIYPNGAYPDVAVPLSAAERKAIKEKMSVSSKAAIFMGSNYPPNTEAAEYIINQIAKKCPEVQFLIVGGVCDGLGKTNRANVKILGSVSDGDLKALLHASDLALNPVLRGSGTNVKMFEYFACGLPTISTAVGARGIKHEGAFIVCDLDKFPAEISCILADEDLREKLSRDARSLILRRYNWNKISRALGVRIRRLCSRRSPRFSVVVPMYRGDQVEKLIDGLNRQTSRDFEVIIVDSGMERGTYLQGLSKFNLLYFYEKSAGAAAARNIGIRHARGEFVAFTDDDCIPDPDWLAKAGEYLDEHEAIGIEGDIYTDESKLQDRKYRALTNMDLHGLGFMTANLIIRRDVLSEIGGFDERLDRPHFREDTDLAWRALEHGDIPFVRGVRVYHPPHLRSIEGESRPDRDRFFINDALLYSKFPDMYIRLMKKEKHFKENPNFWMYFIEGASLIGGVDLEMMRCDLEIARYMPESALKEDCCQASHMEPEGPGK